MMAMNGCTIGTLAGLLGVLLLTRLLVARRLGFGGGGRCGPGGGRGFRRFAPWARRGPGQSFWLRAAFHELDTTPGQEREIRAAFEELFERGRDAKQGLSDARDGAARAVGGETFDEAALEGVLARFDATSEKMKDALGAALRRVHGVLDTRQRARLAELLARGRFGRWSRGPGGGDPFGGPYRGGAIDVGGA